MTAESFKSLLEDLYGIYSPGKSVDSIISKYNGREFDAVKTIYFRYNFTGHPNYDPELGTDAHVKRLIKNYSQGNRMLSKESILAIQKKKESDKLAREKEERDVQEGMVDAKVSRVGKKVSELGESFEEKMGYLEGKIEEVDSRIATLSALETRINNMAEKISTISEAVKEDDIDYVLNVVTDFSDKKLEVPDDRIFDDVSVNHRYIIKDTDGRAAGLEVKSVLIDFYTDPEKPVKEIFLSKH